MEIFETRYYDSETEIICQIFDLGKLTVQLTPTGPKIVGTSSPRVRISHFFFMIKRIFKPHGNTILRHVSITSLLRYILASVELVCFHSGCKFFSVFVIN